MALYSGPVIDTHHHIWLRKDVGWLADPPIPRMFGDYFGIRRDYPVEEWINDIVPQGVTKSVHVTAMWGPGRALDETRWLQSVADKHGFPHGIVCNTDLADPNAEAALKAQKQFPNLRGVRQMLYWDSDPVRQAAPRADLLQRSRVPPWLCAAGEARSAFRIAGLCRAREARRRIDQGVSKSAHDPSACRHANRAHAGSDQRVACGAHRHGRVPQSAREAFRARHVQPWHHRVAGSAGDPRHHPDFRNRAHHLRQQFSAREIVRQLRRFIGRLSRGACRNTPRPSSARSFTTMR